MAPMCCANRGAAARGSSGKDRKIEKDASKSFCVGCVYAMWAGAGHYALPDGDNMRCLMPRAAMALRGMIGKLVYPRSYFSSEIYHLFRGQDFRLPPVGSPSGA